MSTTKTSSETMSNYRWIICSMLFFATAVNYLDRQVLSLTWKDFIAPEFHWTDTHYGTITAIFSIIYAIANFLPDALWTGWEARKGISGYCHLVARCLLTRTLRMGYRNESRT